MAVTVKELVHPVYLTNVNVTYYTANKCRTLIDKCTVRNNDFVNQIVIISLLTAGGDTAPSVILTRSLAPGETYLCPEVVGHELDSGSSITAQTLVGDAHVALRVSGREVTGI